MNNPVAVPHRFYQDEKGNRISLFTSHVPPGFVLVEKGWTIKNPDGTYGNGRCAFATQAEAQAWIDARPFWRGMSVFMS